VLDNPYGPEGRGADREAVAGYRSGASVALRLHAILLQGLAARPALHELLFPSRSRPCAAAGGNGRIGRAVPGATDALSRRPLFAGPTLKGSKALT
jgi:hypothetical protein